MSDRNDEDGWHKEPDFVTHYLAMAGVAFAWASAVYGGWIDWPSISLGAATAGVFVGYIITKTKNQPGRFLSPRRDK